MKPYFVRNLFLFTAIVFVALTQEAFAQRVVDVSAGYGTLQKVLSADSLNRVANPNTVYRLHRGSADSLYYLTTTLTDWGTMPLKIESVGSGALPTFVMPSLSDGSSITPMISCKADFSLKGVFFNGYNTLGVAVDRMVRIQNDGVTVHFDSCQVNMSSQSFVRVDNTHAKVYLKDCRVSNVFSDWANARGVDNRGITIDTLSMIGCSFFRIGYRIYRDGGGTLTYGYFDHNTFDEVSNSIFGLGSTIHITFTNNLAINCGFLGQNISGNGRLLSMTALPGAGQSAYITHNVFYSDTAALNAAFHTSSDTTKFLPWFADTLVAMISAAGLTATNIASPVTFIKAPNDVPGAIKIDSIARWYWRNVAVNSTDASMLKVDSFRTVNLKYNTNAPAYTFGTDGKPVGALDWFGISSTGVKENGNRPPSNFSLEQNYPNPFNPSTMINYQLAMSSFVRVKVYDILGREVATLVNEQRPAGRYETQFDGSKLPSGIYFYRLQAGNYMETKKMMLIK